MLAKGVWSALNVMAVTFFYDCCGLAYAPR